MNRLFAFNGTLPPADGFDYPAESCCLSVVFHGISTTDGRELRSFFPLRAERGSMAVLPMDVAHVDRPCARFTRLVLRRAAGE